MSVIIGLMVALFAGTCSASPASRILNGSPTTIESLPSIVQLDYYNPNTNTWSHNCGGNILNELYILSAAHCTDPVTDLFYSDENRRIRAGSTYRNTGGVIRNAASILNHPTYNSLISLNADICIIRLRELLTFSERIRSIAILPQGFVIPDGAPVTHAGWGAIGGQPPSPVLLFVNLVHRLNCEGVDPILLTDQMVCAGTATNTIEGACSGDSGGPLYYADVLAGVISWGPGGCINTNPTVSARVASFTNWILENTP